MNNFPEIITPSTSANGVITKTTTNDFRFNVSVNSSDNDFPEVFFSEVGYKTFSLLLFSTLVLGGVFNIMSLCIFAINKHLRTSTNMFIVSLAINDVIVSLFVTYFSATSSWKGGWIWGQQICDLQAFLTYFLGMANLLLFTAVSVYKYITIIRPLEAAKLSPLVALLCATFCWFGGFSWAALPWLRGSNYSLEGVKISCRIAFNDPSINPYAVCILILFFVCPVAVLVTAYCKLHTLVRKVSVVSGWSMTSGMANRRNLWMEKKSLKTILTMVVVYLGVWTPYVILSFLTDIGEVNTLPILVIGLPPIVTKTSTVWNPLIFLCTNKEFRNAFYDFFSCKCVWSGVQKMDMVSEAHLSDGTNDPSKKPDVVKWHASHENDDDMSDIQSVLESVADVGTVVIELENTDESVITC